MYDQVTFNFQALEAFSNHQIQALLKGTNSVQRRGGAKELSANELERELATEEKLATVLPDLFKIKTPKRKKVWERFVKLKRARDSSIHLKKRAARSELDIESLYFQFLNDDAKEFPRAALSIVEHFLPSKRRPPLDDAHP